MKPIRTATVWLDGCSGCHMSLLDSDERLLELNDLIDVVYSPLADIKEFPEGVEITLVEGSVSTEIDEEQIILIRSRTELLVSLGDCAITANIPGMRNKFPLWDVIHRAYVENAQNNNETIITGAPRLFQRSRPVHEVVSVDLFLPGCPPPSHSIFTLILEASQGRSLDLAGVSRFGA